MNASPIDSWEGAEAYFTFADNPAALIVILSVAVAVTIGVIAFTFKHESSSYDKYR